MRRSVPRDTLLLSQCAIQCGIGEDKKFAAWSHNNTTSSVTVCLPFTNNTNIYTNLPKYQDKAKTNHDFENSEKLKDIQDNYRF